MDVIQICNPIITFKVLLEGFKEMGSAEFDRLFASTIRNGDEFTKVDDSKYSAALDEAEATMYANHVRSFLEAFRDLKQASDNRIIREARLARTIALWQLVTTFKTLNGPPGPTE